MAKLKIVDTARADTLYADLLAGLGGRVQVIIGHNTSLVLRPDNSIGLRLYSTDVVVIYPDNSVEYSTGGYLTTTTIERMKHIGRITGHCVSRAGGYLSIIELCGQCRRATDTPGDYCTTCRHESERQQEWYTSVATALYGTGE